MQKTSGMWRVGLMLLLGGSMAACSVSKQEAPGVAGPSGLAQGLTLSASPDRIRHDGTAQSVITVSMINDAGQPLVGQRVSVGASTGFLSHVDVVTGSDGRASFIVTAPALSTPAEKITVYAAPFGSNADETVWRNLAIVFTGTQNTTAPTPAFTFAPETPVEGGQVVFDASTTMDEGQVCGGACFYSWDFGGLGAGTTVGQVVARNAIDEGTWAVTLTVTDSAGTIARVTRAVTVEPPPATPAP